MKRSWNDNIQHRKYYKIRIIEDSIEQEQLVNDFIQNIEITALKKSQR